MAELTSKPNSNTKIKKILIANRGEIACRIIRTANSLGIRTCAVYSEADCNAQHVKMADEAFLLGPAPAAQSYLNSELILTLAGEHNVDAIHPGYGFLSENASFAQACKDKNIIFIGPSAEAISAMGSKSAAKSIMEKANVPLVPGYHGDEQAPEFLRSQAKNMGYPVLLKAAAGGGGKGMRQVHKDEDFMSALEAAKRESQASFGDSHMLIEKYLLEPRHVEIQVFCDNHGNGVYLFERDCSVQRRHQKIIEEAPAPNMPENVRQQMGEAALKAAHAIGYSGAGTVEFLYDTDGSFYFMEMNTRLQVEHPVTEMITGEDLVHWQIQVANNQPLPKTQAQLAFKGHAFEARIYAEDPDNEFLPATGTLNHLSIPKGDGIRVDTGVIAGDEVSIYYDPMIAKLIVHAPSREDALAKLNSALRQYEIVGVKTNIEYLLRVSQSQAFTQAQLTTDFVERHHEALKKNASLLLANEQAMLAFIFLQYGSGQHSCAQAGERAGSSAFSDFAGFRLNHHEFKRVQYSDGEHEYELEAKRVNESSWSVRVNEEQILVNSTHVHTNAGSQLKLHLQVDMQQVPISAVFSDIQEAGKPYRSLKIFTPSTAFEARKALASFELDDHGAGAGSICAPMNGTVVEIMVKAGQTVAKGDALAIVEAMKMEHSLSAPFDGTVGECYFKTGDRVDGGAVLLELEPENTQE